MKRKEHEIYEELEKAVLTGPNAFFGHLLRELAAAYGLDGVSFFEPDLKKSLLSLKLRYKHALVFEHEENIRLDQASPLGQAILRGRSHAARLPGVHHLYIPFSLEGQPGAPGPQRSGVIRAERAHGKRGFRDRERQGAAAMVRSLVRHYYRAEYADLARRHERGMAAVAELTEIFATSIRVRESFKHILTGVQKYFGFDRVRLYLIDKGANKLKGEYSADIRGQVKSISYDEIPLEPGAHRFADIVLGKSTGAFMDRYRECVLYLPLVVQGSTIGLLIVDNILSQHKIDPADLSMLKSFAGQIALAVDNVKLFDKVEELSLHDELTKLPLRRYFMQRFQEEFYRAERSRKPMALVWIDLDYFKEINDTYGHQIGDKVLKEVGRVILGNLRKIDFPCRYGGDEILILLPETGAFDAKKLCERLAAEIRDLKIPVPFSRNRELQVSLSVGISVFPHDASSTDELLRKADEALYKVKSSGRGAIMLFDEKAAETPAPAQDCACPPAPKEASPDAK